MVQCPQKIIKYFNNQRIYWEYTIFISKAVCNQILNKPYVSSPKIALVFSFIESGINAVSANKNLVITGKQY